MKLIRRAEITAVFGEGVAHFRDGARLVVVMQSTITAALMP